ncbi:hypothetical protein ACFQ88_39075 [Paenibacillus sp. NPDC056579]|uniref:hypothetical protein n=1 Tax=Paenibacillus sp. NPDC056579 TaxID=3345871 RepID=UPI0036AA9C33
MGVERPALYSAFGNKEALFRRVLARYYEHFLDFIPAALHGMAVQAKAGFSRDMLEAVAEQALSTWPTGSSTLSGKSS